MLDHPEFDAMEAQWRPAFDESPWSPELLESPDFELPPWPLRHQAALVTPTQLMEVIPGDPGPQSD